MGHWPRCSWPGWVEAAGEAAEQHRLRAGGGEGDADFSGSLDDPARDLEQVQPEGGELGGGELVRPGDAVAQGQQQPVGGGVQDKTDLVGQWRAA